MEKINQMIWGLGFLVDKIRLILKEREERIQKRIEQMNRESMFPLKALAELHVVPKSTVESIETVSRIR